jgi:hypothetical protein
MGVPVSMPIKPPLVVVHIIEGMRMMGLGRVEFPTRSLGKQEAKLNGVEHL